MNKKNSLKRHIQALDFAIYEMVLFLDTHPNDRRAQTAFNDYTRRRAAAVKEYEAAFGPYITRAADERPDGRWNWIDGPWPWEYKGDD